MMARHPSWPDKAFAFLNVEDEADAAQSPMITRLREAAWASGVIPDDPLAVLIEALTHTVSDLDRQQAVIEASMTATADRIAGLLQEGRDTAHAEVKQLQTQAQAAEIAFVGRVAEASAKAAAAALTRRARHLDRRIAATVGICLIGALGLGTATGWWLGNRHAAIAVAETDASLRIAFHDGPDAAGLWLDLMQWNDPRAALMICKNPGEIMMRNGRRACRVPLWVERPPQVIP